MFPLLFPLFVRQFGGFLVFLAFSAPFFSVLFPWASQACLVLVLWGGALLEEGYPGWAIWLAMLRRISFVSCSFFCYSWPLGHWEA